MDNDLHYDYVLFIDEAGDDGLARVKPIDPNGASEWLIISGVLVRAEDEMLCRGWLDEIRIDINSTQSDVLHYKNLSPTKRLRAAEMTANLNIKAFVVCSNKKNMRGHTNPRAAAIGGKQWFYNWLVKILLERATVFCHENAVRKLNRSCRIKVLFSKRGGHSYEQTKAYWRWEAAKGSPYLSRRSVKWEVIDFNLSDDAPHYMHAGLQLADIVASAFYQAVEKEVKHFSPEPAMALKDLIAKQYGLYADFGVVLQPHIIDTIGLSSDQKQVFENYGYVFRNEGAGPGLC